MNKPDSRNIIYVIEADEVAEDMDPYELMDPVEILSKMPKDYYEKIVRFMLSRGLFNKSSLPLSSHKIH